VAPAGPARIDIGDDQPILNVIMVVESAMSDATKRAVAVFRFYAELNDFLPKAMTGRELTYVFNGRPAVKDAIEAQGVPHTEVDLILCNGVVQSVAKEDVTGQLGPETRRIHREFRRCPACGRVYWRGSHCTRLLARLQTVLPGVVEAYAR